jgi:RNA polymerase sigma-70 factor (ECF subfamily)
VGVKPIDDLVETCWPDAYRIAYSVLHNDADAEDAAQEACAQLHVALPALRDDRAFKRWFYRIVVRKAYAVARARNRHAHDPANDIAFTDNSPENTLDLRRALDRLPQTQRLAIIFHYYYGFPDNEVAAILGTTYAAVRVRLFAARRSLRRLLEADSILEGSVCHDHS